MNPENVVVGNDALLSCEIPSFVSDMVAVVGWADSQGTAYNAGNYGK